MAETSWEKMERRRCEQFLRKIDNHVDPTWGFYVYGTYMRPQGPEDAKEGNNADDAQKAADDARFQAVVNKLHAHAADTIRYGEPAPYNEKFIDSLRLRPAAYLPGASLADVCAHFNQNYYDYIDPERKDDAEYLEDIDYLQGQPNYNWCLIVDDESLRSIENGPEPIGTTPPENAKQYELTQNADEVFVTFLSRDYTTMKPRQLSCNNRNGVGGLYWYGWLKFSPVALMRVWDEVYHGGDIETYYEGPDKLLSF